MDTLTLVNATSTAAARGREQRTTDRLAVGDLVLTHGMLVRLATPPRVYRAGGTPVYAFDGLIENVEQVLAAGRVPATWVRDGHWTVQGNRHATWTVLAPDRRS